MSTTSLIATGQQVALNFKNKSHLTLSVGIIFLAAFSGMVTAAYTADHIKKSACDMTKDAKLKDAYKWATGSAVLSGLVTLTMGLVLFKVAYYKNKTA